MSIQAKSISILLLYVCVAVSTHSNGNEPDYLNCGEVLLKLSFESRILVNQADELDLLNIKLSNCQDNCNDILTRIEQQQLSFNKEISLLNELVQNSMNQCKTMSVKKQN